MTETKQTEEHRETGKFYTAARNFKQLVGVLPDGTQIPGGPYTITQGLLGAGVLLLGFILRPIFGGDLLQDSIVIVALALGTVYISGMLPTTRRNPVKLVGAVYRLTTHSSRGLYRGRPIHKAFNPAAQKRVEKARRDEEARAKAEQREKKAEEKKAARAERRAERRAHSEGGLLSSISGRLSRKTAPQSTQANASVGRASVERPAGQAGHPSLGRLRADLGLTDQHH